MPKEEGGCSVGMGQRNDLRGQKASSIKGTSREEGLEAGGKGLGSLPSASQGGELDTTA